MHWYTSRFQQEIDLNPPSYLIERISDLEYVSRLASKHPSEAQKVLLSVMNKLDKHHDDDYVTMLNPAFSKMLDHPDSSRKIISRVISLMVVARDDREMKEKQKWWKT